ncbi:uncharacterized protein PSFLO_05400 [Pseudozyma flocculosa]|uniref:Histone H1 n=1 Tax=Pseudozyma flocculosa TaxID=84751 RepID=A0A5C3F972_9BASI|nr:uncharacterized protein PSFLO_05400 [Pseudozyma flocculosa]
MSAATATKPAAKKAAPKKAASGTSLTYEAMIKAAIAAHPTDARTGISRSTIKKYLQSHYPETAKLSEASFNTRVNQTITRGAEKKTFVLPKGPSGKVKLAPKEKAAAEKKVKTPAADKKPAAAAAKKPAAKKPAAKKTAAAGTKKAASTTATKAKKPAAKAPAKKPAAKKAAAKKA